MARPRASKPGPRLAEVAGRRSWRGLAGLGHCEARPAARSSCGFRGCARRGRGRLRGRRGACAGQRAGACWAGVASALLGGGKEVAAVVVDGVLGVFEGVAGKDEDDAVFGLDLPSAASFLRPA